MIAALIIVFREVIEAGLIVGIVLAVTTGIARRGRWVTAGIAVGVAGATLVAIFTDALSSAYGWYWPGSIQRKHSRLWLS